jgi:hypothetical protein
MKVSGFALALLTTIAAVPANAEVVFSTVHTPVTPNWTRVTLPNTGITGAVPRGGPIGMSFYVSAATTITNVSLQLTANNPADGATTLVYIVPDTGTGGPGVAAMPTFTGSGPTLEMTGAILVGSLLDSLLPTASDGTLFSFNTYVPVDAGEYWLVAGSTLGTGGIASTSKWAFDATPYTAGTGTTGQKVFWQAESLVSGNQGKPFTFSDTLYSTDPLIPGANNLYIAQIEIPEPFSIAILGVGLAGIGLTRRRRRLA